LDDPDVTERAYAAIGERLASAGVNVELAPVADVNVDPRNPVIGVRSFGSDPDVVARHVAAAVRGVQSAGIAACVKHFPGHGATTSDSHHEVATLRRSRAELDAVELPPFRAAIAAGTRAVMTGHLIVPSLDAANLATVSKPITTDLLRNELGFAGTTVTDALEMRALADTLGMEGGFVAALAAGADAIETGALDYPEFVAAIAEAVQRALDDGRLERARLEEASTRTAALSDFDPVSVAGEGSERRSEGQSGDWDRCIEVLGTLPRLERPLVVECRPPAGMASGDLPWSVAEPLARRLPGTDHIDVQGASSAQELARRGADRRVVLVVRDPVRHAWQLDLLELATVIVDVGWPVELPTRKPSVRTRGVAPGLLDATAAALTR
jgi:beta-N-acetylhexosaminidase